MLDLSLPAVTGTMPVEDRLRNSTTTSGADDGDRLAALCSALAAEVLAAGPGGVATDVLETYRAHGAGRAAAGAPLNSALGDVDLTVARLLGRWWARVGERDLSYMLSICAGLERARRPLQRAVNDGFVGWTARAGVRSVAHRAVVDAVLAGTRPDPDAVTACGFGLASGYRAVCTPLPPTLVARAPAALRTRLPEGHVLSHHDGDRLWVLVPGLHGDAAVSAVLDPVWELPGADPVGGMATASTPQAVPETLRRAAETLRVARRSGRRGLVEDRSLAVERVVERSPDLRAEMATLVDRLAGQPYLVQTLRMLYDCDLDRGRTAQALQIARRTLTSRLDRVEELTRIRPTSPRGVQVLLTALAAFDLGRNA